MAPSLKAILLIIAAMAAPANAVPDFNFYNSLDCTGTEFAFKAFRSPDTLNGPCVQGYWTSSGNFYLKPTCTASTGILELGVWSSAGCSGTADLDSKFYISGAAVTDFTSEDTGNTGNRQKYGKCVQYSNSTDSSAPKTGSVHIQDADDRIFANIIEAQGSCTAASTSGNGASGAGSSNNGAGSGSGASGSSNNGGAGSGSGTSGSSNSSSTGTGTASDGKLATAPAFMSMLGMIITSMGF